MNAFNPVQFRAQFPALAAAGVYLDSAATTLKPLAVIEASDQFYRLSAGNVHRSQFAAARQLTERYENARERVAALLNAPSGEDIVWTRGTTEAINMVAQSYVRPRLKPGDEIIVTELDHYANVSSWQQAANDKQVTVHQIPLQQADCSLDVARLCEQITAKTRLVAVTYASNVTGSIVDIKTITEAAHRVGAQVYVDAVHYAPHNLIDVQALGCDFLVCSAYKFFGPHIGMAYIAPQWLQRLQPYKVEPATDVGPGRFETGTQSFEGLAGVTAAVDYLAQWGTPGASLRQRLQESFADYHRHEENLCRYFLQRLQQIDDVQLYGSPQADCQRRTPTFALTFKRHAPEQIARRLGRHNICVGSGHFYAQGLIQRLNLQDSGGVLRIGMMHYNTLQEIDSLFELLISER